jgi:hypothetical protein
MQRRSRARRARREALAARPERVEPGPATHDEVERALGRLDPDARLAVELRYLYDLDYREIAHILRKSEIACRIRVHRAIARLRRELGGLAPAMIAALPLLGGAADARAELARNAAATAGTVLGGGLLMATKLKIAAVAVLALAVLLLWNATREDPEAPSRSSPERRDVAEAPGEEERAAAEILAQGASREGASGAEDETEPPLSPGNGCVRGLIRFEDGEPRKGVRVSLWGESKVCATTDEQGRFHLHDDRVAEREVYLAGPAGIRGPDGFAFLLREVKMVPDETARVEIVVKRGLHVASRVVAASTGAPVEGATIGLRQWENGASVIQGQGEYGHASRPAARTRRTAPRIRRQGRRSRGRSARPRRGSGTGTPGARPDSRAESASTTCRAKRRFRSSRAPATRRGCGISTGFVLISHTWMRPSSTE